VDARLNMENLDPEQNQHIFGNIVPVHVHSSGSRRRRQRVYDVM